MLELKFNKINLAPKTPAPAAATATPMATPTSSSAIAGDLALLDTVPQTASLINKLSEIPSLEDLAREFQNSDQPEKFDDVALAEIHKACLALESSIDNADEVREQLTFIMTELRKFPDVAAKIYDSDIATMVKALRHNYNIVAFAKQTKAKQTKAKNEKISSQLAELEDLGLFDGL